MTMLEALLLGLLQGVTEFLPVSSSGHLTLLQRFFGMQVDDNLITLDIVLHGASLLAIFIYFGRRWAGLLRSEPRRVFSLVTIATIPTALIYPVARTAVMYAKGSLLMVSLSFMIAGVYIAAASFMHSKRSASEGEMLGSDAAAPPDAGRATWRHAFLVGIAQTAALLPGVSRSGATISTGLFARLSRSEAFELSFLIGAPVMAGGFLLEAFEVGRMSAASPGPVAVGFAASLLSGLAALGILRAALAGGKLWAFGAYTLVLGTVLLGLVMGGA